MATEKETVRKELERLLTEAAQTKGGVNSPVTANQIAPKPRRVLSDFIEVIHYK